MIKRIYKEEVDSTMTEASITWEKDKSPLVVVASSQAAGRGRRGREWISPEGGFYATYVFRAKRERAHYLGLSLAVGVAVVEALNLPNSVSLKWPNDIMANGELKIGGILIEFLPEDGLSIGIGLNVAPLKEGSLKASSLSELGVSLSPSEIENRITEHLLEVLETFEKEGFAAFRARWLSKCGHIGKHISLDDGVSGTVEDISSDGALILDGDRRIVSGTVL